MAQTKKDMELRTRIINLAEQIKGLDEKELINTIAGICGVSLRTTKEHYRAYKAQKTLNNMGFKEKCNHQWGTAFSTASGLTRECKICHKTENIKL